MAYTNTHTHSIKSRAARHLEIIGNVKMNALSGITESQCAPCQKPQHIKGSYSWTKQSTSSHHTLFPILTFPFIKILHSKHILQPLIPATHPLHQI